MGTDIYYHAEKRDDQGSWNRIYDELGDDEFFYFGGERNYELFEILCGSVDPESGLTSRGFEPITPKRGEPEPTKPSRGNENDGSSWLLLQELIDFPWETKCRTFAGYADAKNYQLFYDGEPFRFSPVTPQHRYRTQSFPKPEWTVVSNEKMLERIVNDESVPENLFTPIEFSRSYANSAPQILTDTIPKLLKFGDPQNIRIVFWFDC